MNVDIDALQSAENGKTSTATAIGSVLEAPQYSRAAATSIPTLPTAESMPALAPQPFLADIPSLAAFAFDDRTVIAAEAKSPVDRPGQPASETSTNEADGAAARAIQVYPEHPYVKTLPPIVGASQLCDEADTKVDFSANECTAEAIAAIDDLDDEPRIPKMMRVGAAIDRGKVELPHGSLTHWYKDVLEEVRELVLHALAVVPGSLHPSGRARLGGEDETQVGGLVRDRAAPQDHRRLQADGPGSERSATQEIFGAEAARLPGAATQ